MNKAPPLPLRDAYFDPIEAEINRIFYEVIYKPLTRALGIKLEMRNARKDALVTAIENGTIYYENGRFFGKFNAATSRRLQNIGAKYNSLSNSWSLAPDKLPPDIRMAQAAAAMSYQSLQQLALFAIDDMDIDAVDEISDVPGLYVDTIEEMDVDFSQSVKNITIPPKLTEERIGMLAAEWGQNLDLYIKKWMEENILKLRQEIQANAFAGRRAEDMEKYIQHNYGVSRRKAKFLARQETSLLMSKFNESRYRDIGSVSYQWWTADDERVRHDHAVLNGSIQLWVSPPITNRSTGARNHPGEDFGCRCIPLAIIPPAQNQEA